MKDNKIKAKVKPEEKKEDSKEEKSDEKSSEEKKDSKETDESKREGGEVPKEEQDQFCTVLYTVAGHGPVYQTEFLCGYNEKYSG